MLQHRFRFAAVIAGAAAPALLLASCDSQDKIFDNPLDRNGSDYRLAVSDISSAGGGVVTKTGTHSWTDTVAWDAASETISAASGVPASSPAPSTITYNGQPTGAVDIPRSGRTTVLVEAKAAGNTETDTVHVQRRRPVFVVSNLGPLATFSSVARAHLYAGSPRDTATDTVVDLAAIDTSLRIRVTLDGTDPTPSSTALANGYIVSIGATTTLRASAWRNDVRVGPVRTFSWAFDSTVYDFDGLSDSGSLFDSTRFAKTAGVSGFTYNCLDSGNTGSALASRPLSELGTSGHELALDYSMSGPYYPCSGIGLFLPWNPVKGGFLLDARKLASISFTIRDTRSGDHFSPLKIRLSPSPTDSFAYRLATKLGIAYMWSLDVPSGATRRVTLDVADLRLPSWAAETPPPVETVLSELESIRFEEGSASKSGEEMSGRLEIDDLVLHFK